MELLIYLLAFMKNYETTAKSSEYYTPKYVFDALECRFDLDVCSPVDRSHCCTPTSRFITSGSLSLVWDGFVWMNPPWAEKRNSIVPWLKKIRDHGNGIALTPDRTSTPWWQDAAKSADLILFVSGRICFIKPDGTPAENPTNGTTLFAYGDLAKAALKNAERNNLGITLDYIRG